MSMSGRNIGKNDGIATPTRRDTIEYIAQMLAEMARMAATALGRENRLSARIRDAVSEAEVNLRRT